jgi:hypothetical protein
METKRMRACSYLLPDPGGEVVRKLLDKVEELENEKTELVTALNVIQESLFIDDYGDWYLALSPDFDPKDIKVLVTKYEEGRGWKPIESAPTKGRELILLLTPSRFPQVAYSNTWWTCGFSVENKPTHWMPLPELPREKKS